MEESLGTEIRDLQSVVKKKEEALESRDSEVNDLKSKRDVLVGQVTHLELAIQQAKGEAASEAQHSEQVIESLKLKIATLEAQLTQTEQIVGGTDKTIKGLDQDRVRRVIDLTSELAPQTNRMKEMSSFFKKGRSFDWYSCPRYRHSCRRRAIENRRRETGHFVFSGCRRYVHRNGRPSQNRVAGRF